jgi:O-acetyl-ADP-ribose deacetylase (regulator of RNase III)
VAGINLLWRASEYAIRQSVKNALQIATIKNYQSIAFPLIGAGTGGFPPDQVLTIMQQEAEKASYNGEIRFVKFKSP